AAGYASVPTVEIGPVVEFLPTPPTGTHGGRAPPTFLGHFRQAAIGRLHQQRGPAAGFSHLDPVALTDRIARILALITLGQPLDPAATLGKLLVGQQHTIALLFRPLKGQSVQVIDRPTAPEVRVAP